MSRLRMIHGQSYRTYGKSPEKKPSREHPEDVFKKDRRRRSAQYIRESKLTKMADWYRPKGTE